jgi:hypothetical protein
MTLKTVRPLFGLFMGVIFMLQGDRTGPLSAKYMPGQLLNTHEELAKSYGL